MSRRSFVQPRELTNNLLLVSDRAHRYVGIRVERARTRTAPIERPDPLSPWPDGVMQLSNLDRPKVSCLYRGHLYERNACGLLHARSSKHTWEECHLNGITGLPYEWHVASTSQYLYLATCEGLWRSTDGDQWKKLLEVGAWITGLTTDPEGRVAVQTEHCIAHSVDDGESWQMDDLPTHWRCKSIFIHCGVLYVAPRRSGDDGPILTDDGFAIVCAAPLALKA